MSYNANNTTTQTGHAASPTRLVVALLVSCALGLGCNPKKPLEAARGVPASQTAESVPSSPPTEAGQRRAVAAPSPPPLPQTAITHQELAVLNQAVAMYGRETMGGKRTKFPTSVEQLVREKFLAYAPVAPPGMKLIINPRTGLIEMVGQ